MLLLLRVVNFQQRLPAFSNFHDLNFYVLKADIFQGKSFLLGVRKVYLHVTVVLFNFAL
jgi:hypothetical protein